MSKTEVSVIDASREVIVEILDTVSCGVKAIHNVAKAAEQGTALLVDVAQGRRDAVQEGLAADDQRVGPARGLGGHVLAPAEADLQPDLRRLGRQGLGVQRPGLGVGHGDGRQQGVHQGRLARLDRAGLDAAEGPQGTVDMGIFGFGHGFRRAAPRETEPGSERA